MQQETTKQKLTWTMVNVLVLIYAFVPVIWIISLSLKDSLGAQWPRRQWQGSSTQSSAFHLLV